MESFASFDRSGNLSVPSTPCITRATASAIAFASSVLSPSEHVAMSAVPVTPASLSAFTSDHGGVAFSLATSFV